MKINDIGRWRSEIQLAEKFRDDEFGKYSMQERSKAGENIDYFEKGYCTGYHEEEDSTTTLNLFHTIIKLIVPSLYFQNPRVMVTPRKKNSDDTAPIVRDILNYFYQEMETDSETELAIWDAYVLNRGITKVGYCTKFGIDVENPEERKKTVKDRALEAVGLKKKTEEEVVKPEIDQRIVSEFPYIKWVSPFRFLMDCKARTINEAMWVCEEFDKTVAELKRNKHYKNTSKLQGGTPDIPKEFGIKIPETEIEEFRTVRVYEIHYRNDNKLYRLVIAKDGEVFKELYHEESIYEMEGFQYDVIEFNRHGHLQFKKSDMVKIKNLQDRFTSTLDAILEQLDRFQPKVAYDSTKVTSNGQKALSEGDLGALVECNSNPSECIREISLTQLKADLKAIIDEILNIITIMTGVTKAKLLGISTGDTATGEHIAQGGENIRMADMDKEVQKFARRQVEKLWQIVKQFVPLEELEIVTGESGINPMTGKPVYIWMEDIDSETAERLQRGQYRLNIEVASTRKVDTALMTKRIENLISILGRTDVIALMQQQGKKVDLAEILKLWLHQNPEMVSDPARIVQDVNQQTQGLLPAQEILLGGGQGGMTTGSQNNAQKAQEAAPAPDITQLMQEAGQV